MENVETSPGNEETLFQPKEGWGPDRNRAALSVTFDNFGEAAELEVGWWEDKPIGQHPTATFMYDLIEMLGDVRTCYYVEASNADIYPEQLKDWQKAGHEIGIHAWRHEFWSQCTPEQRVDILNRSFKAFEKIGVHPVGFRPPGGAIPHEAWQEFADAGLQYASPLAEPVASQIGSMISLPFRWPDVDVFAIDDRLDFVREQWGADPSCVPASVWNETCLNSMKQAIGDGHHRVVIFHPESLLQDPEYVGVLKDLIEYAKGQDVWIAPPHEVSQFIADNVTVTTQI